VLLAVSCGKKGGETTEQSREHGVNSCMGKSASVPVYCSPDRADFRGCVVNSGGGVRKGSGEGGGQPAGPDGGKVLREKKLYGLVEKNCWPLKDRFSY